MFANIMERPVADIHSLDDKWRAIPSATETIDEVQFLILCEHPYARRGRWKVMLQPSWP